MTNYAWGGYLNGQIPSAAMAIIPGTASFIKKELIPGVVGLRAAFRAHFGYDLAIVEAYRPLSVQQYLYAGWIARKPGFNLAAYPGTSMHGWGLSIDFGSNVNVYGSATKAWMDGNAPRFGFLPTGNSFSPREAWHFDGIGAISAGGTSTPLEDNMPLDAATEAFFTNTINGAVRQAINEITGKPGYGGPNTLSIDGLRQDLAYLHSGAEDSLAAIFAKAGTVTLTDAQIDQLALKLKIDPAVLLQAVRDVVPTAEQNGAAARAAIVK